MPIAEATTQLQQFLAATDTPCPSCDYNLRGLTADTCPECNQRLTLRVGLAEARQRAFIAALVGLALGVGFHGLFVTFVLYALVRGGASKEFLGVLAVTLSCAAVEGAAMIVLLRKRRLFQRRPAPFKAWIAAGAWAATAAGFVLFLSVLS